MNSTESQVFVPNGDLIGRDQMSEASTVWAAVLREIAASKKGPSLSQLLDLAEGIFLRESVVSTSKVREELEAYLDPDDLWQSAKDHFERWSEFNFDKPFDTAKLVQGVLIVVLAVHFLILLYSFIWYLWFSCCYMPPKAEEAGEEEEAAEVEMEVDPEEEAGQEFDLIEQQPQSMNSMNSQRSELQRLSQPNDYSAEYEMPPVNQSPVVLQPPSPIQALPRPRPAVSNGIQPINLPPIERPQVVDPILSPVAGQAPAAEAYASGEPQQVECPICFEMFDRLNLHIIPCGHNAGCADCSSQLRTCPSCRGPIDSIIPIYGVITPAQMAVSSPRTQQEQPPQQQNQSQAQGQDNEAEQALQDSQNAAQIIQNIYITPNALQMNPGALENLFQPQMNQPQQRFYNTSSNFFSQPLQQHPGRIGNLMDNSQGEANRSLPSRGDFGRDDLDYEALEINQNPMNRTINMGQFNSVQPPRPQNLRTIELNSQPANPLSQGSGGVPIAGAPHQNNSGNFLNAFEQEMMQIAAHEPGRPGQQNDQILEDDEFERSSLDDSKE